MNTVITVERVMHLLRDLLPSNLYIGGSTALALHTKAFNPNDLDLFYYGPKPFAKWVLLDFLARHEIEIVKAGTTYDGKYKIAGQYWFLKLEDKFNRGPKIDLIFIDPSSVSAGILGTIGSDLAAYHYQIDYSSKGYRYVELDSCKDALKRIQSGECYIYLDRCTPAYAIKALNRCELLNLKKVSLIEVLK